MNKNICFVTDFDSIEATLNTHRYLLEKLSNKFDNVYLLDSNRFKFFKSKKKKNFKYLIKKKNIKEIKINNFKNLNLFFKNNNSIIINNIGKNLSDLKLLFLIRLIKIPQVQILNTDVVSYERKYEKHFLIIFKFFFQKKIIPKFITFLSIVGIISKIDICLIHDVDKFTFGNEVDYYFKLAMNGAYKAIQKLKEEKVIKAIGVGLNDADICAKFANEGDFDCMVLAGRYSLLEHESALNDFFPIVEKKNIGIILAGVFNSGILAKGIGNNVTYNYDKIPNHIREKYIIVSEVCDRYNVPVPAAALQFSYANKLISSMILGMDRVEQIKQNISFFNHSIPDNLWKELIEKKIIDERCPIP
ncbi:MAG: hypothetical protein CBC16_11040 [Verrucomicrobia bacterium TMED56]|nr:MAG: hypothetical protein CBC16_11040 [Verrucomicrobia bacterium TMED56]